MNIAHQLTFSRILLSPLFVLLYLYYNWLGLSLFTTSLALLFIVIFSELTDLFDGYFARRMGQVTELGKIFDPLADSIARVSMLLCFTQPPIEAPLVFVFILIFRDSLVSSLRTVCALEGFTLAARTAGKVKAIIQGATIFLILGMLFLYAAGIVSLHLAQEAAFWSCGITALYTLLTLLEYLYANRAYILRALKN